MAFEALLENRDNAGDRQPDAGGHILRSEQAVALYRGPFLDDDECQDWIDRRRERLRRQFAQAVRSLSEWRKDQGQQDAAFRCLNDALKAEPLYLRLITWCQAAGRQNDAKAVWAQYRRAVVEGAGREPSAEMCRLAKSFS